MAQYRQLGNGLRNGVFSDHVSIGVRGPLRHLPHRRSKPPQAYRLSLGCCVVTLSLILSVSAFFYLALQGKGGETNIKQHQDNGVVEMSIDTDFLTNVTRRQKSDELKFGHESIGYGRDSRYWDKDDRRRDNDYDEGKSEEAWDDSVDNRTKVNSGDNKPSVNASHKVLGQQGNGLYNEAGRNELKMYEAEYEASLKDNERSTYVQGERNSQSGDTARRHHKALDDADEYDDGIDLQDDQMEEYDDGGHDEKALTGAAIETKQSSHAYHNENWKQNNADEADKDSSILFGKETLSVSQHSQDQSNSGEDQRTQKLKLGKRLVSKKKPKRRKFSGTCEMKTLNSSSLLVEPLQSRKFARFSLQYTEKEEKAIDDDNWEPRFAGHQSLAERKESFIAQDQKINCGFVKGPSGSPSTGFDLAEDDAKYISSCHIAVMSCIFGNSDRLRSPLGKTVSRFSRKNVCFVMFVDEVTLQTISSEGQMPDMMGFVGLWKLVVVKNLPYTDMRRVGKIPKFLPHRLFTSARYSIWLDSKLRLQLDPIVILEYFLWRKGHEYAISNHYDRHCLWEEVAQNKKLNKYNHSVIDEQFAFYQADGMRRFNASDPNKLLPSNVPEGSVIIRAHTSMSNLFSCLWFNEVDRFTPRDQLSFAYTYHKLRWMNPEKPFYLNMFKDCERRKIAKLYHHRSTDRRNNLELKE